MVDGSVTAMGAPDVINTSTQHIMEIIWKKHQKRGHLYKENMNRNDRYIVKSC